MFELYFILNEIGAQTLSFELKLSKDYSRLSCTSYCVFSDNLLRLSFFLKSDFFFVSLVVNIVAVFRSRVLVHGQ